MDEAIRVFGGYDHQVPAGYRSYTTWPGLHNLDTWDVSYWWADTPETELWLMLHIPALALKVALEEVPVPR